MVQVWHGAAGGWLRWRPVRSGVAQPCHSTRTHRSSRPARPLPPSILTMSRLAAAACCAAACFALAPTPSVVAQAPTLVGALTGSTDPTFGTLAAALGAAGLVDTFDDPTAGPFTVFAPTDEAFATTLGALDIAPEALLADVPVSADRAVSRKQSWHAAFLNTSVLRRRRPCWRC